MKPRKMREPIKINQYKNTDKETVLIVTVPKDISYIFKEKAANSGEIRIDDGNRLLERREQK